MEIDEAYHSHNIDPHLPSNPGNHDFGNRYTSTPLESSRSSSEDEEVRTRQNRLRLFRSGVQVFEDRLLNDSDLDDKKADNIHYLIDNKRKEIDTILALAARSTERESHERFEPSFIKQLGNAKAEVDFSTNESTVETLKASDQLKESASLKDKQMMNAFIHFCESEEWKTILKAHEPNWKALHWRQLRENILNAFFEDARDREFL